MNNEEYTGDAGTCKYTIELLGYYYEDKSDKTFEHKKVTYADKVSNGFKKLLDMIGLGEMFVVAGEGVGSGDEAKINFLI